MSEPITRARALALLAAGAAAATFFVGRRTAFSASAAQPEHFPYTLTDAQWKAKLPPEAYDVLRHEGTEYAWTSPLLNEHRPGTFACLGCDQAAFDSKTKFDSGTGWPSFYRPLPKALGETPLGGYSEVHCSRCGGHLGHVFNDGPQPTGLRYCIDGVALKFTPRSAS